MNEYLKLLDATREDTPEELRKKWLRKCREHHPDKGGDPAVFRAVTHAYKMLTDPSYRRENKSVDTREELLFHVKLPVSFEDAFFGKTTVVAYNRVELGMDKRPLPTVKLEEIVLTIEIPPGSMMGLEHREEGKGLKRGNLVGDALVSVVVNGHPKFVSDGRDIISQESIPLELLLKGGTTQVWTMYGMKKLRVPPGTQPGERLKIKKCGVQRKGNHMVVVEPRFPSQTDLKSKTTLQDLIIDWETYEKPEIEVDPEEAEFLNTFDKLNKT